MYSQENDEVMPGKDYLTPSSSMLEKQQWRATDVQGLATQVFNCPSGKLSGMVGEKTAEYAMNADVQGVGLGQIPLPYATVLTTDTKGTDSLFSVSDIAWRHAGGFIASFLDGHVMFYPRTTVLHDPEPRSLLTGANTAADYNTPGKPAMNPFILQGATNVIDARLTDWGGKPNCFAYQGKRMLTSIDAAKQEGVYISVSWSQLPTQGTPRDVTIGTFVNGLSADYAAKPPTSTPPYGVYATKGSLVIPAAGMKAGYFTTFWLPPMIGDTAEPGHARYQFYTMTGNNEPAVIIMPDREQQPPTPPMPEVLPPPLHWPEK